MAGVTAGMVLAITFESAEGPVAIPLALDDYCTVGGAVFLHLRKDSKALSRFLTGHVVSKGELSFLGVFDRLVAARNAYVSELLGEALSSTDDSDSKDSEPKEGSETTGQEHDMLECMDDEGSDDASKSNITTEEGGTARTKTRSKRRRERTDATAARALKQAHREDRRRKRLRLAAAKESLPDAVVVDYHDPCGEDWTVKMLTGRRTCVASIEWSTENLRNLSWIASADLERGQRREQHGKNGSQKPTVEVPKGFFYSKAKARWFGRARCDTGRRAKTKCCFMKARGAPTMQQTLVDFFAAKKA
jgi:hypothetical protein